MANRVVKVGLVFEFFPDTEHADAFVGLSNAEIVLAVRNLVCQDIEALVNFGELFEALRVDLEEVE